MKKRRSGERDHVSIPGPDSSEKDPRRVSQPSPCPSNGEWASGPGPNSNLWLFSG